MASSFRVDGGEKKKEKGKKEKKGNEREEGEGSLPSVSYCGTVALWEVTVLLLRRHHGPVSRESGPLFAITPTPGEISHIARLACWGLKCQSRREVFKLGPLRRTCRSSGSSSSCSSIAAAAVAAAARQTLTGTYANRHFGAASRQQKHTQTRTAAERRHALMHAHTKVQDF